MPAKICILGNKYARLKVIGDAPPYISPQGIKVRKVKCVCNCGNVIEVTPDKLKSGNTKSCGCFSIESTRKRSAKHGYAERGNEHPLYGIWFGLITRCEDRNRECFSRYGGRSIKVCERWRHSFPNFISDMGDRPTSRHTVERIHNDGDYCPENCKWDTYKNQNQNKSNVKIYSIQGITGSMPVLCDHFGINKSAVKNRIYRGWNTETAFTYPLNMPRGSHGTTRQ